MRRSNDMRRNEVCEPSCLAGLKAFVQGALAAGLVSVGITAQSQAVTNRETVTVFAASSATDCLTAIARQYESEHAVKVRLNFAASSTLARQIEQGAPCDVFLSADVEWMDYLAQRGDIRPPSRKDLLGNRLVIVTPTNRPIAMRMVRDFDLSAFFAGRLAVGDPEHVPAGKYAKEALTSMGWWEALKGRLAPAENVRAALKLVERGETDAGIVYLTDARASQAVSVAAEFPESAHKPIHYPAALCKGAGEQGKAFLDFLSGPEATKVWTSAGFVVLDH